MLFPANTFLIKWWSLIIGAVFFSSLIFPEALTKYEWYLYRLRFLLLCLTQPQSRPNAFSSNLLSDHHLMHLITKSVLMIFPIHCRSCLKSI